LDLLGGVAAKSTEEEFCKDALSVCEDDEQPSASDLDFDI